MSDIIHLNSENVQTGKLVTIEYLYERIWWLHRKTIEMRTTQGRFPFPTIRLNEDSKRPRKYFPREAVDEYVRKVEQGQSVNNENTKN